MMRTFFSKVMVSGLILAVSFSAVLCCNPAMAHTGKAGQCHSFLVKTGKSASYCPHCKPNHAGKDERPCCLKKFPADQISKTSLNVSRTVNELVFLDALPKPEVVVKDKYTFAYFNGPPGPVSDPPLYIPLHSFRI